MQVYTLDGLEESGTVGIPRPPEPGGFSIHGDHLVVIHGAEILCYR